MLFTINTETDYLIFKNVFAYRTIHFLIWHGNNAMQRNQTCPKVIKIYNLTPKIPESEIFYVPN